MRPPRKFRHRFFWRAVFFISGSVLIIFSIILALWKTSIASVRAVEVEGNNVIAAEFIQGKALEVISLKFWWPLPGNLMFFPEQKVKDAIQSTFPRLETIDISRNLFKRKVKIKVKERSPTGIYCQGSDLSQSDPLNYRESEIIVQNCFLIDKNGVVFAEAPKTEGTLILSLIDTEQKNIELGQAALTPDQIAKIEKTWSFFRQETQLGVRFLVRNGDDLLTLTTLEGWKALFDVDKDIDNQVVALRELIAKELGPQQRSNISVVDLRVPGKIYYQ